MTINIVVYGEDKVLKDSFIEFVKGKIAFDDKAFKVTKELLLMFDVETLYVAGRPFAGRATIAKEFKDVDYIIYDLDNPHYMDMVAICADWNVLIGTPKEDMSYDFIISKEDHFKEVTKEIMKDPYDSKDYGVHNETI